MASNRLRVAAINFLNPAPLMWDFEHAPRNVALAKRYSLHYTMPSQCAEDLLAGRADLGLIPIASLTTEMAIVPGCAIASLDCVRSIQLIVKTSRRVTDPGSGDPNSNNVSAAKETNQLLAQVRTVATDTASRSSLAYAQILFRRFLGTDPAFLPVRAEPITMLEQADAALLIGDPALLALDQRAQIEQAIGPCVWFDLAQEWCTRTGLPWVAAVWAVGPDAFSHIEPERLIDDLQQSRNHGLAHIDDLVKEWTSRIAIPPDIIRSYLTQNIHYELSPDCIAAIEFFRRCAVEADILPPLAPLRFL